MIESINYQLRKITKTRGHFPTDDALIKLLYLGCREMGRRPTAPSHPAASAAPAPSAGTGP